MGWCPSPEPSSYILPNPQKGAPLTQLPQREMLLIRSPPKILSQQLHRFPNGPLKQETPVSRIFCTLPSKSPVNGPPPPCPPSGSPWREKLHLQGQWLSHSFISVGIPNKESFHKQGGRITGNHPRIPTWTEGLHTLGCGLVPQRDRLRHCDLYPSAMQPLAWYLPRWLG